MKEILNCSEEKFVAKMTAALREEKNLPLLFKIAADNEIAECCLGQAVISCEEMVDYFWDCPEHFLPKDGKRPERWEFEDWCDSQNLPLADYYEPTSDGWIAYSAYQYREKLLQNTDKMVLAIFNNCGLNDRDMYEEVRGLWNEIKNMEE